MKRGSTFKVLFAHRRKTIKSPTHEYPSFICSFSYCLVLYSTRLSIRLRFLPDDTVSFSWRIIMRADSPDQWKSSFFCHCSILFSLLAPLGPQFGVSAFPHRQPHRYVSKCPLPSPESVGEKENDTHETHFSQSVIRNMDRATGKARTRHKLISSVSPFPLTVWVALAVTCYLADKREVRLQNQIRCRIRSTVQQPCWRIQNKAFQIALLTGQTLKGDHDMFLVWWNAGPRTDRSDYHVWNLSKQRKCLKHI